MDEQERQLKLQAGKEAVSLEAYELRHVQASVHVYMYMLLYVHDTRDLTLGV